MHYIGIVSHTHTRYCEKAGDIQVNFIGYLTDPYIYN